jgi:hypothetical protein
MRPASAACFAAIVVGLAGCNVLTGIGDYSTSADAPWGGSEDVGGFVGDDGSDGIAGGEGGDAQDDGGTVDGGDDGDAGSGVVNGDFESPACAGWTADEATLEQVDGVAYTGKRSCKVCTLGVTGVFGIAQDRGPADGLIAGKLYVVDAWVRAPDTGVPTQNMSAVLTLEDGDGGLADRNEMPGPLTLDTTWRHVTTTLTYQAGLWFTLEILARTDTGCFLVDDVSLHPAD